MTKKEIIGIVNDAVENKINSRVFSDDERYGIGCNQFRELAAVCAKAECYEEVELQIMYNKAKDKWDDKKKSYTSWRLEMKNGKDTLADVVISCMREVKDGSSEKDCLKNLSLMFGYFYWNARICAAKNKEESTKNKNSSQQRNNYSGNNQKQSFNGGRNDQKRG